MLLVHLSLPFSYFSFQIFILCYVSIALTSKKNFFFVDKIKKRNIEMAAGSKDLNNHHHRHHNQKCVQVCQYYTKLMS